MEARGVPADPANLFRLLASVSTGQQATTSSCDRDVYALSVTSQLEVKLNLLN
jgi:hypothetical protein